MALPDVIEIEPLSGTVSAAIAVPGSKSITNRALVCAALAKGETVLHGALWSEDTEVMVEALRRLGFSMSVAADPLESGNRTLRVVGCGGTIPKAGTISSPLEIFVGNAGTAARFLAALLCLGQGTYRLSGVPRMHERPQGALFSALRQLGYGVESPNERLPAVITGRGPLPGSCEVSVEKSSQFASALLLCARHGGWTVRVLGDNPDESPYVRMTEKLVEVFPQDGGGFQIEPDASSGSYFWGAKNLLEGAPDPWECAALAAAGQRAVDLQVTGWPVSGWQIDARFPSILKTPPVRSGGGRDFSRVSDLGDAIMTAIVLAPFWRRPTQFTDLGRLRVQECERVQALRCELTRCGACVVEAGDTLTISPSRLHGACIETYNDHRMAMCFAMLGLKVPGMRIVNPACVKKTFPNFFEKLAAAPPHGLGARILDPVRNQELGRDELFAE
jgi:3-phosphoshikimate 1-carboxyvinyltransferase